MLRDCMAIAARRAVADQLKQRNWVQQREPSRLVRSGPLPIGTIPD